MSPCLVRHIVTSLMVRGGGGSKCKFRWIDIWLLKFGPTWFICGDQQIVVM